MNSYYFSIIAKPVEELDKIAVLFNELLASEDTTPFKCGDSDPLDVDFDVVHLHSMAELAQRMPMFFWRNKARTIGGSFYFSGGEGSKTASIGIWTNSKYKTWDCLGDLFYRIAKRLDVIYGCQHYVTQDDFNRMESTGAVSRSGSGFSLNVNRWKLIRCIPDVFWANIYGPEYVALFGGRGVVENAPAKIVREMAPNTFYIQISDNVDDLVTRHEELDRIRDNLINYLGRDCFFDASKTQSFQYKVPDNLGWREPIRLPTTEADLKAWREQTKTKV